MKQFIPYSLIAAVLACGLASAQTTAYTTPVGYVSITCTRGPAGSDTRVGLPLRQPTVAAAALTATPSSNILTVSTAAFGAYANTHYVKFTSGPADGKIYAITANDATTITINLNGDILTAVNTNTFSVSKYWTLGELFDPALITGDPLTTGNAIVGSASALARKTEVLLPNHVTAGINLAPSSTFYVTPAVGGTWRNANGDGLNYNAQILLPDSYFIIRNRSTVTSPTTYVCTGEVDMGNVVIPLNTRAGGTNQKQDVAVALTRPVDVTLDGLGLGGTAAFMSSASALAVRDVLYVFSNTTIGQNKASSASYFYSGGMWVKSGQTGNWGSDIIPAGSGIVIRKYGTTLGATDFWKNTSTY